MSMFCINNIKILSICVYRIQHSRQLLIFKMTQNAMNKIQNEYLYKVYDLDLQINSKKMESRDFLVSNKP